MILHHKDTIGLELVRLYAEEDKSFFSVVSRPHEDIEARTIDLATILAPALGLRVRQETTASKSVTVCPGYLTDGVYDPIEFPETGVVTTLGIPDAAVGKVRVDLIYLDLSTRSPDRAAGTEVAPDASPPNPHTYVTAWAGRGTVADVLTSGIIPLAYVFVDDAVSTVYDETTLAYSPGAILDVRPPPGTGRYRFATSAAQLLSDTPGGSFGVLPLIPRADHAHPSRVDATVPQDERANSVASFGTPLDMYARADHEHDMVGGVKVAGGGFPPADILPDTPVASVGTENTIVRADHQHGLNVDVAPPVPLTLGSAGSVGVSTLYSRADHVHALQNVGLRCVSGEHQWGSGGPNSNEDYVLALPFDPLFAIVLVAGRDALAGFWGYYSMGMYSGESASGGACSFSQLQNAGADSSTCGYDITGGVGGVRWAAPPGTLTEKWSVITFSQAAGLTLRPNANVYAYLKVYVFGQEV